MVEPKLELCAPAGHDDVTSTDTASGRLQSILSSAHVGTWDWNVSTGETTFSEECAKIVGYTLAEFTPGSNKIWESLMHPEDFGRSKELLGLHFAGELPYFDCEVRMKHKNGQWIWVQIRGRVVSRTEAGEPLMMFGSESDITDRKRAEESNRFSEIRLQEVLENSLDASYKRIWGSSEYEYISPVFTRISGYTPQEMKDLPIETVFNLMHPEDLPGIEREIAEAVSNPRDQPYQLEYRFRHKDGNYRWLQDRFVVLRGGTGAATALIGSVRDITELKQALEALATANRELERRVATRTDELRLANEKLKTTIDEHRRDEAALKSAHLKLEALWAVASLTDADLNTIADHVLSWITRMSESKYGFYGFVSEDESVMTIHTWSGDAMKDCSMPVQPQDFDVCAAGVWAEAIRDRRPLIINDYAASHAGKKGLPQGHVALTKLLVVPYFSQGRITTVAAVANRATDYGQDDVSQITGFLGSVQAIVERKRIAQAASRYARNLIEASLDPLVTINPDGKIADVNTATETLTGLSREALIGSDFSMHFTDPEAARAGYLKAFEHGKITDYPLALRHLSGSISDVLYNASVYRNDQGEELGVFAAARDITALKRAEAEKENLQAQNLQLQKAESLGRMAGAVAHHFNNQLQVVSGNLELALEALSENVESSREFLTDAMTAAGHAGEVSSLMLTYLGQSVSKRAPLDLAHACRRSLPLLVTSMPKDVRLDSDLPSPGPIISADESQIQQLLANLLTNAWEACEMGVVKLSIRAALPSDIAQDHCFPVHFQNLDSAYACLEVADTGCGIASKDINSLFDPFFSTKFTGRGMGLPVVLGIVRAHHGAITVQSEQGEGSSFRVYFPLLAQGTVVLDRRASDKPEIQIAGRTVLVVEDDDMIRELTSTLLRRFGANVFAARDGVEAVELFQARLGEIHCVLCDLTMPRMNGWETLTALRRLQPEIPVILTSGYSEAQVMTGGHSELPQALLKKPYRQEELLDAFHRALALSRAKTFLAVPQSEPQQAFKDK